MRDAMVTNAEHEEGTIAVVLLVPGRQLITRSESARGLSRRAGASFAALYGGCILQQRMS